LNEEKRYKIQFIDSEEDVTRTVRLSLRSLRVLAVGAGAAVALLTVGAVLSIEAGVDRLYQVPGTVPSPREFVDGDRFAPRSSYPTIGLHEKPHMRAIPGTTHSYAVTDELLSVLGESGEQS